jgi:hypothetical protein
MSVFYVDTASDEQSLRTHLYSGDLLLFTNVPSVWELVHHTRALLNELFAPHDPELIHLHHTPAEIAEMLAKWKPAFIHNERSKDLVKALIREIGFSPTDTHYDVPKPRTAFPVGHLTTGIAFAFPWHRDTWYAAPPQQINWWLPVYDVRPDNSFMFDLEKFANPVANTSAGFDYYEINRARLTTAKQVKRETQSRPEAPAHQPANPFIPVGRPGSVLLFSGSHLHATIPNTSDRSRYSIDFRTVDRRDVAAGAGAQLVDVECTGTALRDFVSIESGERIDEPLIRRLHGDPPEDAMLVFPGPADRQPGKISPARKNTNHGRRGGRLSRAPSVPL